MSLATQYKNNVVYFIQTHYGKILVLMVLFLLAQGALLRMPYPQPNQRSKIPITAQ